MSNEFKYLVTGVTTDGKRFSMSFLEQKWAFGINLYRGSVWEVHKESGKRRLLRRVWN